LDRLEQGIRDRGLTLFAHIDHKANAETVGLEMQPAHVLIFGNAKAGTPLMAASPLLALDLPLKVLVWQDRDGRVWVSYNSTAYLAERYGIPDALAKNIAGVDALVEGAMEG
jgi:uncharacterized protein (DUF302 family)